MGEVQGQHDRRVTTPPPSSPLRTADADRALEPHRQQTRCLLLASSRDPQVEPGICLFGKCPASPLRRPEPGPGWELCDSRAASASSELCPVQGLERRPPQRAREPPGPGFRWTVANSW